MLYYKPLDYFIRIEDAACEFYWYATQTGLCRDSLTPKGRREAELLSRRLCRLNVKAFYVLPLGRAQDTAAYTLSKVNRTAETLPWLAEFSWTLLRRHGP